MGAVTAPLLAARGARIVLGARRVDALPAKSASQLSASSSGTRRDPW
jgi:NADP-dependent 3-hydroxy acid dehydrogenase YdfG